MSAPDLEFRWTLWVSALAHASLLGVLWFSAAAHAIEPKIRRPESDVWIGTTVSVVEEPRKSAVPAAEASPSEGQSSGSRGVKSSPRAAVPELRKIRASATPPEEKGDVPRHPPAATRTKPADSQTKKSVAQAAAPDADSVDLKRAMQNSINQPASEAGTFGAAGVDLTERRLPKAFTRALPVAIGAEPGWWKQHMGSLGHVKFTVALTESGKLDEVTIDDESRHPFHARVVRRVAKLLALGTFALPTSTVGSSEQSFELRMVLEQSPADTNSTADPGDLVEKGFEAPTAIKPGQAIVRDAPGHTLRAFLKLLPPKHGAVRADDHAEE